MTTSATAPAPPKGADALGTRTGRRSPTYTDIHDWVTFANITEAKGGYVILRHHVDPQVVRLKQAATGRTHHGQGPIRKVTACRTGIE